MENYKDNTDKTVDTHIVQFITILRHSSQANVYLNTQDIIIFEIYTFEITATSPNEKWLNIDRGSIKPQEWMNWFV